MPGPVLYAELQRAEEALREQRGLYETLLQVQSDLGHCVIVSDGNQIEFVNDAGLGLFGYSREQLLALPSFLELVAPSERDLMIQRLQRRFLEEGKDAKDAQYETRVVHRDGHEILVEVSAKPVQLPNGIRIVTLLRDVSERRRLETRIRQSEETLRTLFDTSSAGFAQIDPDGRFLRTNQTLQQMLGYASEELLGRTLGSLTYAEDLPKHDDAFRRFQNGEAAAILEKRMVRKDGSLIWVHNALSLVRDASGQPLHGIVVTHDITHHRRLVETNGLFTSIVESSSDGIVSAAPDGTVTTWNKGMERITGYKASEVLGRNFQRFAPPEQHQEQIRLFRSVLNGDGVVQYRTERLRRDGSRYPAAVTMSPIRAPDGAIVGVSALIRDITEEKRAEEQKLRTAEMSAARAAAEAARERFAFLAEAGKVLSSSLDLPSRLVSISQLPVPKISDWALLYLQDEKGAIRPVSIAHQDKAKVAVAERVARRHPLNPAEPAGPAAVIRTGQPELIARITDELLVRDPRAPEHLRALRELGPTSSLTVPLLGRTRTIGALVLMMAESGRSFAADDQALVDQFAQRAALAIENAILYDQRRRAEESLRRLASIVEASEDAIVSATLDGTVISWNAGAERLFGFSSAEILGRPWTMLVPMEREGELATAIVRLRAGEHIEHFESERIAKDGRRLDVSIALSPLRDGDGTLIGMSSIIRDITERARFEDAIRASQAELQDRVWALQALHRLGEAIARSADLAGVLENAMTALREALRADRTAVLTYDAGGVMRFRAWHGLSDSYRAAVEGHSPWKRDERDPRPVLVPNASEDPSLAALMPIIAGEGIGALAFVPLVHDGRILGKFMIYYDSPHGFTGPEMELAQTVARTVAFALVRRTAEDELRQKERMLSDFFENATIGLHWVGPDGKILWANPAELRMLGYAAVDYIGHDVSEFHVDAEVISDIHQRLLRGDVVAARPARMRAKDGSIRHVIIDSSGYFEDGRFVHSRCFTRDATRQTEAEASLRERERRLALVSELSHDGVLTADEKGQITYANAAAAEMFGRRPEQLVGQRLASLLDAGPDPDLAMLVAGGGAAKDFKQRRSHARGRNADGTSFPAEVSVSRLTEASRPIIVAHVQDLRQRARIEKLQSTLQAIVQASEDAIISASLDGTITSWNAQAQELYGYTAAEMEGRSLATLAPRDRKSEWREFMAAAARGETVEGLESVRVRKDGSLLAVRLRVAPLVLSDGKVAGASIFARDVTEERERAAQVTLFRSVFEWSSDGIAIISPSGEYILQNEAHRRLLGYSDEEIRGKTPALHLGEATFAAIAQALGRDGRFRGEVQSRTRDGPLLDVELSAFSIRDASGTVIAHVGIKRDITERKRLERAKSQAGRT